MELIKHVAVGLLIFGVACGIAVGLSFVLSKFMDWAMDVEEEKLWR